MDDGKIGISVIGADGVVRQHRRASSDANEREDYKPWSEAAKACAAERFGELIEDEDDGASAVDAALAAGHGANTATSKDTNPKDAVAAAHLKFSSLPLRVLAGVALALSEGAWKYGRHNYRVAGVNASVYFDACMDHLLAWFEGEDIDPDSGRHHIDKAIAGLFVLRDAQLGGMCTDDRPPAIPPGWIAEGHAATKELFERMRAKYPEARPPFVRGLTSDARVVLGVDPGVPGSDATVCVCLRCGSGVGVFSENYLCPACSND